MTEVYKTLTEPSPVLESHIRSLERFTQLNSESKSGIIDLSILHDLADELNACLQQNFCRLDYFNLSMVKEMQNKMTKLQENIQKNFILAKTNWEQKDLKKKKPKKTWNQVNNNMGVCNICSNNRILEKFLTIPEYYIEHLPLARKQSYLAKETFHLCSYLCATCFKTASKVPQKIEQKISQEFGIQKKNSTKNNSKVFKRSPHAAAKILKDDDIKRANGSKGMPEDMRAYWEKVSLS